MVSCLTYLFHVRYKHFLYCEHRYSSRLSYAHTSAVVSMVGYILGLGDRHGENILFDSTNGDCVHVDFNCLFNRVMTFYGLLVWDDFFITLTRILYFFIAVVRLCPRNPLCRVKHLK